MEKFERKPSIVNDRSYRKAMGKDPVILNHFDPTAPESFAVLQDIIHDCRPAVGCAASCECGRLTGNYFIGVTCPDCRSKVVEDTHASFDTRVFIEVPLRSKYGVLHPVVFQMLANVSGFHYKVFLQGRKSVKSDYITASVLPTVPVPDLLKPYLNDGEQSFDWLGDNFDLIVGLVCQSGSIKPITELRKLLPDPGPGYIEKSHKIIQAYRHSVGDEVEISKYEELIIFLDNSRKQWWVRHIPVPNKTVLETTTLGGTQSKYADKFSVYIKMANKVFTTLHHNAEKTPKKRYNTKIFEGYANWLQFVLGVIKDRYSSKRGIFRSDFFGSRHHLSFRAVIIPLSGESFPDVIHLPWRLMVRTWAVDLCGRLLDPTDGFYNPETGLLDKIINPETGTRFTPIEAYNYVQKSAERYDPLIDRLLTRMIQEAGKDPDCCSLSGKPGLPVVFNRNPSIDVGSMQLMYVTDFKRNTEDKTISISCLNLNNFNADFDGDYMNGVRVVEIEAIRGRRANSGFINKHVSRIFVSRSVAVDVANSLNVPGSLLSSLSRAVVSVLKSAKG